MLDTLKFVLIIPLYDIMIKNICREINNHIKRNKRKKRRKEARKEERKESQIISASLGKL